MNQPILEIHDIHKKFKIGAKFDKFRTLRQSIVDTLKGKNNKLSEMWALKGISFDVQEGDVIGIIGKNGSGKSTLLKVLSRITPPTKGYAVLNGRVASLLEVGTGFHPELTGRENVFFNGALLGLSRKETARKFDEIVAFSGIEQFLETAVKHYSSGMQVRLAFSVAAHLEPEILIIDEVLSVGDAEFRKKCMNKMQEVTSSGRTILFVSHDMGAVLELCNRGVLLNQGNMVMQGTMNEVVERYVSMRDTFSSDIATREDRNGNGMLRFNSIQLLDEINNLTDVIQTGQYLKLRIGYKTNANTMGVMFNINFHNYNSECIFECNSDMSYGHISNLPDEGVLECIIPKFPLLSGSYQMSLRCQMGKQIADAIWDVAKLEVVAGDFFGNKQIVQSEQQSVGKRHVGQVTQSPILIDHKWKI